MRRSLLISVIAIGACFNLAFAPPVLVESDTARQPLYPHQISELASTALPTMRAVAAILVDVHSGEVLVAQNEHQRLPPASTTKIMTALLALERGNLEDVVTVGNEVYIEGARAGLVPGERLTLRDLLYALLLPSGNDAAMAIARHIAGSEDAFVALMNNRAQELGLADTHFTNPHGLDASDQYSSAYDLQRLALAALAKPDFARIVATRDVTVGSHYWVNRNELLGDYLGADGVKTGTTEAAGECLVASATRDGSQALVVVLGSTDRYADARTLLDYYYAHYACVPLDAGPQIMNRIRSSDGEWRALVVGKPPMVLLARWKIPLLRFYRKVSGADAVLLCFIADQLLMEIPLAIAPSSY